MELTVSFRSLCSLKSLPSCLSVNRFVCCSFKTNSPPLALPFNVQRRSPRLIFRASPILARGFSDSGRVRLCLCDFKWASFNFVSLLSFGRTRGYILLESEGVSLSQIVSINVDNVFIKALDFPPISYHETASSYCQVK